MQRKGHDPQLGRFAQADTIIPEAGNPKAWDRYSYVNNNPLIYNDPSGHCIDGISTYFCILVAGAMVGALVSYGTQVVTNIAESGWSVEAFTNVDGTAIASAAVAGVVGTGLGIAGAAVVGTGFLATIATGVVGGAASGQASRATTNVLTDQDIGYGLGKPQDILLDGLVGGAFSGVGFGVGAIKNSSFYQGKFPETSTNRFLYKQNGFAEYDIFTGEAKYRVDFSGPSHRGIETPHLHYPNWNQPPKGQKIFNGWDKEIVSYNKILTKIIEGAIRWME